ncbi:MAG: hypothetical protein GC129_04435 [Proteobacteria bacterium]|nr:hypothetical protein [Pseudomonadota bacterium]
MTTIRRIFQAVVALLVMAVTANFYARGGQQWHAVGEGVYYAVLIAVLIVPAFWAVMHLCGGMLFGVAAGGFLDGCRLGITLGLGMALGKMWPYVTAYGMGVYLGGGPLLYCIGGVVLGVLLFGLDRVMHYFWHSMSGGHNT